MCMAKRHIDYLERTNESDYQQAKISYETYIRFADIVGRCHECDLCGNGQYGDILSECRLHFMRLFASMKRDLERINAQKRVNELATRAVDDQIALDIAAMAEESGLSTEAVVADPDGAGAAEAVPGTEKQMA